MQYQPRGVVYILGSGEFTRGLMIRWLGPVLSGLITSFATVLVLVAFAAPADEYEPPQPNQQGELQYLWSAQPVPVPPSHTHTHKKSKKSKRRSPETMTESPGGSSVTIERAAASAFSPNPSLCIQGLAIQTLPAGGSLSALHPLCSLQMWIETQRELNRQSCDECAARLTVEQRMWASDAADSIVKSEINPLSIWMGYVPILSLFR